MPANYDPSTGANNSNNPAAFANAEPAWNGWNFRKQMEDSLNETQGSVGQADAAFQKASAYDPTAAFKTYTQGAQSQFNTNLGVQLKALAGSAVGSGHLDTGFYDLDQGDLVKQLASQYNSTVEQGALDAANLGVQNNNNLLNYAGNARDSYLSFLGSTYDRQNNDYQNSKNQSGLGTVLGGLAGAAVGSFAGGAGAAAGANLGSKLFGG